MTPRATVFPDLSGAKAGPVPLPLLLARIEAGKPHRATKADCPLFSAFAFGSKRTAKGSLRSTENALSACAIVAEHDAGTITPELARDKLAAFGIVATIYTTASHTPEAPRWRIIAPTARTLDKAEYPHMVARLNGLFGGAIAPESFTVAQSFYFGHVDGRDFAAYSTTGAHVDELTELDAGALYPHSSGTPGSDDPNGATDTAHRETIRTGANGVHAALLSLAARFIGRGMPRADAAAALLGLLDACEWKDRDRDRWRERRASIAGLVTSAAAKFSDRRERQDVPGRATTHASGPDVETYHPEHEHAPERDDGGRDDAHESTPESEAREWPAALDLEVLAERDPIAPRSIMEGIPCGYATGTFGHGGAGKSQIELLRAVCIAAGVPFCGLETERRRVLFISCEDRADILHWRLARICAYLGVNLASLRGWLHVVDLVGRDSILFAPDTRTGHALTMAYGILAERMREYAGEVLVLDGITDTFGGNENARGDVKHFVNMLLALIPADTGALILIGHVNKATAASGATGEGYSGSTAWHNSARARWYLYPETAQSEDGERETRTGRLIFELQKSNHGEVGAQIEFEWDPDAHLFVGRAKAGTSEFDRRHRDRTERRGILQALQACATSNPAIIVPAATTGQRTAFHVLSARPEIPDSMRTGKPGLRRFWRQIEALRQMHAIEETAYRRTNRHLIAQIVLTTEGVRQCAEC